MLPLRLRRRRPPHSQFPARSIRPATARAGFNAVRELWGNNTALTNPLPAGSRGKTDAPQGLGLFSDSTGVFSG